MRKKRRYPAHFLSKLSDADAELAETRHWLHTATSCGYIESASHEALCAQTHRVGAQIGTMMRSPAQWTLKVS